MDAVWSPGAAASLFSPLRRTYLLYGEDDRQKDEAIAAIRAAAVDAAFEDFDYEELQADASPAERVLAAAQLAPFGSPARLVVVRGAEVYRRADRHADGDRLAAGITSLGSGSCLVLRASAPEDERSRAKTVLSARLDAAVRATGVVIRCQALSAEALAEALVADARLAGKRLQPAAAARLVRAAHGDRTALVNELEKAICYAGDTPTMTLAIVEATCSYNPEDVMFRLVEAACQCNADRALCLLHEVLRYDPKPQSVAGRLLSLLARQLRLLTQARDLLDRRVAPGAVRNLPQEIATDLPTESSITTMAWKAGELFATARRWSRAGLAQAFGALVECDIANKGGAGETGGSADVVTNLELLLVRLATMQ